jgi:hypothetical protein
LKGRAGHGIQPRFDLARLRRTKAINDFTRVTVARPGLNRPFPGTTVAYQWQLIPAVGSNHESIAGIFSQERRQMRLCEAVSWTARTHAYLDCTPYHGDSCADGKPLVLCRSFVYGNRYAFHWNSLKHCFRGDRLSFGLASVRVSHWARRTAGLRRNKERAICIDILGPIWVLVVTVREPSPEKNRPLGKKFFASPCQW